MNLKSYPENECTLVLTMDIMFWLLKLSVKNLILRIKIGQQVKCAVSNLVSRLLGVKQAILEYTDHGQSSVAQRLSLDMPRHF